MLSVLVATRIQEAGLENVAMVAERLKLGCYPRQREHQEQRAAI